jgi:reductive dehalogenase
MSDQSIKRRDFLRLLGIGSAALGAGLATFKIVGKTENGVLVESKNEYGGFLVEKLTNGKYPYKVKPETLKPMSQKNTVFSRNVWDPARQTRPGLSEELEELYLVKGKGKVPNQTRLDYALMAASWGWANMRNSPAYKWEIQSGMVRFLASKTPDPWDPAHLDMSWEDASLAVKHAALFYGASLAGIAELNPLWLYSDHFSPNKEQKDRAVPVLSEGERFEEGEEAWYIPKSINRVIALAFEEDYQAIANSPGRVASAAVGNGYSRMAFTSYTLAEFIRALGYRAIPAGNGVGLSIPMAIDAGLGQLGRMGLLITPKYGPRVRFAKVITDMPLVPDALIDFGVTEFCESCMLCAEHCPSDSVTKGPFTWEGPSPSNNPGIHKWYANPEKCYDFNGFSCSNCKRVCPFNKPNNSWLHRMIRKIIKTRIGVVDKLMVTFDQAGGYGEQLQDSEFWKQDGQKTITAREEM